MLDENLPAFFFKKSTEGITHHTTILASHRGSDPTPVYTLRHADPVPIASRNCYAAALFDAYNQDILYAEVLLRPQWSQPTTPSHEDIRKNGGIPPSPIAKTPADFTVQLYNPDQQINVTVKTASWVGTTTYEFSMPSTTFRAPSTSSLDKSQSDPAAFMTTPRLNFTWRKDSVLSKDHTIYMTGKSTDPASRKKGRDPDIPLGLFRSLRELTVYESNFARVDVEDVKGLEIVMLLSAATIKDVYASSNIREAFNIGDQSPAALDGPSLTSPITPEQPSTRTGRSPNARASLPPPPLPDARAQWELDAETASLKARADQEAEAFRRDQARRKRERQRADEAETRRLRRMVEEEERQAREKQDAVDAETERLRREYGVAPSWESQQGAAHAPPRRPASSHSHHRPHRESRASAYMSGAALMSPADSQPQTLKARKKSFWELVGKEVGLTSSHGSRDGRHLSRKASAMW